MTRNLKVMGLALVAMLALGATMASSASAVTDHFTTTKTSALLTGTSHDNEFEITGASLPFFCTTSKFTGTVLNNSAEATIDPEYTGKFNATPHGIPCESPLGDVTVDMNGCHYKLTGFTNATSDGTDAEVWIECPTGQTITITAPAGVKITVPTQTPTVTKGGVVYRNLPNHTGGAAVEVEATVTGITYTCDGFGCLALGLSENNDADYFGTVVATGYEDTDGLPTPVTEGSQIPIEVS